MNKPPARTIGVAALLIGMILSYRFATAAPEVTPPTEVRVTREMVETNQISRFRLTIKREHDMLHVSVLCPKKKDDHLANATLEYLQEGAKPVDLPLKVTVDSLGNDQLAFNTTAETASQCLLSLYIGPKISTDKELKAHTIYRIMLKDIMPPRRTAPSSGKDKASPGKN